MKTNTTEMVKVTITKTGGFYYRRKRQTPYPPATEGQQQCRNAFTENSQAASSWIKANGPEAFPPNGNAAYQELHKQYDRQDKEASFFRYVMAHKPWQQKEE